MPRFIKGLELSRLYFEQVAKPILENHDNKLHYAAGLIGRGSEVLGFDDSMSTDHDWGPSLTIFLNETDAELVPIIPHLLAEKLPPEFRGYSTKFLFHGTISHRVQVVTIRDYFLSMLAWDIDTAPDIIDWLTFPSQKLRALTSGAIFHDGIGTLTDVRTQLANYPPDVRLYLMMAQWERIAQEEHLMGRAGYIGDDLGASIIANRIVSDVMRLCFLMEEDYVTYAKWLGTAFQELACAESLSPLLRQMQLAENWKQRQTAYAGVIEFLTNKHNQLKITKPIDTNAKEFFTRPFLVSDGGSISALLKTKITDTNVKRLFDLPTPIGSIDQISDETTLKEFVAWRTKLRQLYTMNKK